MERESMVIALKSASEPRRREELRVAAAMSCRLATLALLLDSFASGSRIGKHRLSSVRCFLQFCIGTSDYIRPIAFAAPDAPSMARC